MTILEVDRRVAGLSGEIRERVATTGSERATFSVRPGPAETTLDSKLDGYLLAELRDLWVRVEVLQGALGTAISLLNETQRETIIATLAQRLEMTGSEDPRGVAAASTKDLIDYALLPAGAAKGRAGEC